MNGSPSRDFFAGVADAAAPLGVWALHFFGCYVAVAAGCATGADEAALRIALLGATVAALLFCVAWLVRACRARAAGDLLAAARRACALLAGIGIVWAGVPLALLAVCSRG